MSEESVQHSLFRSENNLDAYNYRLFIDDIQDSMDLHEILNVLHDAEINDMLEVRINSSGGMVSYGQQLINVMGDRFNGRCTTVLDSSASSMAALLFMAGDARIIYPHSILMVHDISMSLGGKASDTMRYVSTYVPVFKQYFKKLFKDTMTEEEIDATFSGADFWFDAREMCERGMAEFIIVDGKTKSAEEYLNND